MPSISNDILTRLRLKSSKSKNTPLRIKLLAQSLRDIPLRILLQGIANRDIPLRMILASPLLFHDIVTRMILAVTLQRNIPLRLKLFATQVRNVPLRAYIVAQIVRDARLRLYLLRAVGRDLYMRVYIQAILPALDIPAPPPGILAYQGLNSTVPIMVPKGSYLINGQGLDTPALCTAPLLQGGYLQAGSTFTLIFQNPSGTTQTLLTNGATASMHLFLADGRSITGTVLMKSTTTGSQLLTTFTVLSTVVYMGETA